MQLSEAIARVHRYVGAVTGKKGHVVEQGARPEDLKRRLDRAAKLDPTVQSWLDNMTSDSAGYAVHMQMTCFAIQKIILFNAMLIMVA